MFEVKISIMLKKTVADPQGLIVKHALDSLGYKDVNNVRIGQLITMSLKTDKKDAAEKQLDEMCKKLLANPIIEEYSFDIKEV